MKLGATLALSSLPKAAGIALYPTTRLDLLSTDDARAFYKACGFRILHDGMRKSYL